jgi:hypothetical protein
MMGEYIQRKYPFAMREPEMIRVARVRGDIMRVEAHQIGDARIVNLIQRTGKPHFVKGWFYGQSVVAKVMP